MKRNGTIKKSEEIGIGFYPNVETLDNHLYLHEIILGRQLDEDEMVVFLNGNQFDFRRKNFKIIKVI